MEASTLQAPATLAQPRVSIGTPLLRFRSDEQLVALFRAGHDEAFRAIHDRYQKRLFAYARQMLPARQDAEDALQDVFVRAYSGLRASDRDLALRAWLFRVAHNRCIDELRRPAPPPPEVLQLMRSAIHDPVAEFDRRESLRRLITDVRRLPEQQRSALLLRELGGMSYAELATALGISVGAVKSVLVRARMALAQAAEARDTPCEEIREELVGAYDRGMRPNANTRRHMRDCPACRGFRRELRGVNRQLAALAPAMGPLGLLAKVLGISGGAGGGATAGGATAGGATAGGAALASGTGVAASTGGVVLGAGHVATLIAAAVATAGGAVEIQHTITNRPHAAARARVVTRHAGGYTPLTQRPVGPTIYGTEPQLPVSAAVLQSATSAAQRAAAAVLRHRTAAKHQASSSSPSGSGGGGMIGPATSTPADATSSGTGTQLPTGSALTGDGSSTAPGGQPGSSSTGSGSGGSTSGTTSGNSGSGSTTGSGGSSGSTVNATNNGPTSSGTGTSGSTSSGSTSGSSGSTSGSTSSSSTGSGSSSSTTSLPTK